MRIRYQKFLFTLLSCLFLFSACEDPYTPELNEQDHKPVLVVDGIINANGPETLIHLSYTTPIQTENTAPASPISQARVYIVGDDNSTYESGERDGNKFKIEHPRLKPQVQYSLKIEIGDQVYSTSPSLPKSSGVILGVEHKEVDEGRRFYVNAEGDAQGTPYFKWEFDEAWKFSSRFNSNVMVKNGELEWRMPEDQIHQCFNYGRSSEILINNTLGLNENKVYKFPILTVPFLHEKLGIRYSMLLKQYGIGEEAYRYFEILKKNSEQLGDIFGSMPSDLRGNIKNLSNESELVIGYIEVSYSTEKRVFVDRDKDLKGKWPVENPFYAGCSLLKAEIKDAHEILRNNPGYMPAHWESESEFSAEPTHIYFSVKRCIDCSLKGDLEKPEYWVD